MICRNCNTENENGTPFCRGCGMPLAQDYGMPQTPEQKGFSIASMGLGIVGLVAWCLPIIGFPVTIVGLVLGILGIKKGGKGMAIAGIILSAITLVITMINSILGAYLGMTGQLF